MLNLIRCLYVLMHLIRIGLNLNFTSADVERIFNGIILNPPVIHTCARGFAQSVGYIDYNKVTRMPLHILITLLVPYLYVAFFY